MNAFLKPVLMGCALMAGSRAMAQITFYEGEGYRGQAFTTQQRVGDFRDLGFNDRASSVVVDRGRWEVCDEPYFQGRCAVLRRGSYDSLRQMGFNNRISSARRVQGNWRDTAEMLEPLPAPDYAYRYRPHEQVFHVPVTSARAIVGPPSQRCWIERQQVAESVRHQPNVGGAIIGGLVGGILGHQVGGGSGRDLATAGGVVAGAAIGANSNIGAQGTVIHSRDVQRCENVVSATPAYWDVTYHYGGVEHHVQMSSAPGTHIAVNRNGEPRG